MISPPYRFDEIDTWARTIFGEARGEPYLGQVAVAWVILNRVHPGKTVKDVCLAPKQFSCWNPDDPNLHVIMSATMANPSYRRAFGIACLVSEGDLPDPTDGADHYHTLQIEPHWAKGMAVRTVIGNHRFLKGA